MKLKTKIGIIGFGNFGTLMANVLNSDFDLFVIEESPTIEKVEKAKKLNISIRDYSKIPECDILVLSVPISSTEELIKKVSPLMKSGAVLLDTCSVKVLPCQWLEKYTPKKIHILGTHPMFGPTTSKYDIDKQSWNLDDLQIVVCPLRINEEKLHSIERYLRSLKLNIIRTTPEEHDKQNAKTLSFVHFIGRSLLASGIGHQEIYTPGYTDLLSILPHTTSDNWQLFYDMNNYNPYSSELRETFNDSGLWLEKKILKNQDKDSLDIERDIIDLIDKRIIKLIKERLDCAKEIAKIKKDRSLELVDKKRENQIIKRLKKSSELDEEFIKKLFTLLFEESYKVQK